MGGRIVGVFASPKNHDFPSSGDGDDDIAKNDRHLYTMNGEC